MDAAAGIVIRDATIDDAASLAPLFDALGYPAAPATIASRVRMVLDVDPTSRILVATRHGEVVGFAALHVTPVLHRDTAVGRITAIAVRPSLKGTGVGRALVDAAEAHFQRIGIGRLEVTSGPTHAPAHDFYRRLGYADQGVRFAKTLERSST
jgi:ribosomal protein S18 acetylase RimI-like enzyme